jgi:hypothetical protein
MERRVPEHCLNGARAIDNQPERYKMKESTHQQRKFGTRIYDEAGNVMALHGKVKLGDQVTWLGRKHGSGSHDDRFQIGSSYSVCFIYPSNGDVELQGPDPRITTRAGEDEYRQAHHTA